MQKINKKQGEGAVILGSEILHPKHPTITSGSLTVDVALGGGWATNHWIEIVGHESVGKTLMVLKTIAANQRIDKNWTTIWFATEDFSESYAEMLGVDLSRVIVENENAMETVYEHAKAFIETRAVDCIVIDSLPALIPIREMEGTMEDFQPGLSAFITGKFFRLSNQYTKRSLTVEERPVTGFAINQWHQKIGAYGNPNTTPNGVTKNFFFYQRIEIRRKEFIKNTKNEPIGQTLEIVNVKNKHAPPGRRGEVDAYIARGNGMKAGDFDTVKDITSAARAYGILEQSAGGYFVFREHRWRGFNAVEEAVAADSRLRDALFKTTIARAASAAVEEPDDGRAPEGIEETGEGSSKPTRRKAAPRVGVRKSGV